MALTLPYFDTAATAGLKFVSPEVREELGEVVPMTIDPGSLTEPMYATGSVSTRVLALGAVTSTRIATSGVATVNLAPDAVTTDKLADDAVTPAKTGVGVVTATTNTGTDAALELVVLTAAQYAAIPTKDPNTLYFLT